MPDKSPSMVSNETCIEIQWRELEEQRAALEVEFQRLRQSTGDMTHVTGMLAQTSLRFQELFQVLPVPCFCYDRAGRLMEWNRAFTTLYHLDAPADFDKPFWQILGRPFDDAVNREIVDRVFSGESYDRQELAYRRADGAECYVLHSTFPLQDPEGVVMRGICTHVDISERKLNEKWNAAHARQQMSVMEIGQLAVAGADIQALMDDACAHVARTDGVCCSMIMEILPDGLGQTVRAGYGWPAGMIGAIEPDTSCLCTEPAGDDTSSIMLFDDLDDLFSIGPEAGASSGEPVILGDIESEMRFAGRSLLMEHGIVSGLSVVIRGETGPFGSLGIFSDHQRDYSHEETLFLQEMANVLSTALQRDRAAKQIQDYMAALESERMHLERANSQLEALATQDGLTGLKNHRFFQDSLSHEFPRARRRQSPLSLLLLDVDHFKQYNDQFGHPAGDIVLRLVGNVLKENIREMDLAARYGGEEFAVILPNADHQQAMAAAERLRVGIESHPWTNRPVTVSIGVATMLDDTADKAELIAEADSALYVSKGRGRNCVSRGGVSKGDRTILEMAA